jgi:hypothetical protein
MDPDARALNYILIYDENDDHHARRDGMTPAQRRRWAHKLHRAGERWPADGKGRPTPRQRRPRRG